MINFNERLNEYRFIFASIVFDFCLCGQNSLYLCLHKGEDVFLYSCFFHFSFGILTVAGAVSGVISLNMILAKRNNPAACQKLIRGKSDMTGIRQFQISIATTLSRVNAVVVKMIDFSECIDACRFIFTSDILIFAYADKTGMKIFFEKQVFL